MSRRHLTFAVVALASLIVSACSSSTAPRQDDSTPTPPPTIVTSGAYDSVPTDTTAKIVTSGAY